MLQGGDGCHVFFWVQVYREKKQKWRWKTYWRNARTKLSVPWAYKFCFRVQMTIIFFDFYSHGKWFLYLVLLITRFLLRNCKRGRVWCMIQQSWWVNDARLGHMTVFQDSPNLRLTSVNISFSISCCVLTSYSEPAIVIEIVRLVNQGEEKRCTICWYQFINRGFPWLLNIITAFSIVYFWVWGVLNGACSGGRIHGPGMRVLMDYICLEGRSGWEDNW